MAHQSAMILEGDDLKAQGMTKRAVLVAAAEVGCSVSSRQFERWVELGWIPKARRHTSGYKGGVQGRYPASTVQTVIRMCEFLRHSKVLEAAGLWAWYMDCPVPSATAKRALYEGLREMWRTLYDPPRRSAHPAPDDRIDALAFRYRYHARKLVGGTASDAYRMAYYVLTLAGGRRAELDLDDLVSTLSGRVRENMRQFGVKAPAIELPPEAKVAMRRLTAPSLSRAVRYATVESLEEARRYLRSHTQVVGTLMLFTGRLVPTSEPERVRETFVGLMPIFVAGIILFQRSDPDLLARLPADPPEVGVSPPGDRR